MKSNISLLVGAAALAIIAAPSAMAEQDTSNWVPPGLERAVESTAGVSENGRGNSVVSAIQGLFGTGVRGAEFGAAVSSVASGRDRAEAESRGGFASAGNASGGNGGGGNGNGGGGNGNGGGGGNGGGNGRN